MRALITGSSATQVSVIAEAVERIYPIASLVHVGFGNDRGDLGFWKSLPLESVLLIDAQPVVNPPLSTETSLKVVETVISATGGPRDWTISKLASENSLLSQQALCTRWPHAKGVETEVVATSTLDEVLGEQGFATPNWLVVDMHPATEALQGAQAVLDVVDVVVVRVMVDAIAHWPEDTHLTNLTKYLGPFGLQLIHCHVARNDKVGEAIFVRSTYKSASINLQQLKTQLQDQHRVLQEELRNAQESVTRSEQSSQEKIVALEDEKAKFAAQIDALNNEKAKLANDIAALTKAHADASAARDAEAQAKTQAIAQRDAEAQAKTQAIAQRDAEAKEKTNLIALRDEQTALATSRQQSLRAKQQDAAALQERNQELEAINQENATRQQMLQEELIKAEVQIDLIKDLLLREPGL